MIPTTASKLVRWSARIDEDSPAAACWCVHYVPHIPSFDEWKSPSIGEDRLGIQNHLPAT